MNKSIEKICHISDVHLRKSIRRHDEYSSVFQRTYESIKEKNPNRIVIVGDLFHDFIDLQPEVTKLAADFLTNLAKIAKVIITRGNHDLQKRNKTRMDSIQAIVDILNNDNIVYYNETGLYKDENVTWAVWHHGVKDNNPWKKSNMKDLDKSTTTIDLFHDPINGVSSPTGFEFKSGVYNKKSDFKGDYGFFGDIHKQQFLVENRKAYSSSLIAQDFGEGDDDFHGYLFWNIAEGTSELVDIPNDYSYNNVSINSFTDFDDLDLELENPTKYNRVRFVWNTLPNIDNKENKRKVTEYIKSKYNTIAIHHKADYIEDDTVVDNDTKEQLNHINEKSTQLDLLKRYCENSGVDDKYIPELLKLDEEIIDGVEFEEFTNIIWDIIYLRSVNFMSYENIEIDFRDKNGIYQVSGLNQAGKSTFLRNIAYVLYNKTPETERTMKFGDQRYINNKTNLDYTVGEVVIPANDVFYGIRRKTTIERNKAGEVKGSPTKVEYFEFKTDDFDFSDENNIESLDNDRKDVVQKNLERIIGTYENFMRIILTTSDSLNDSLSSNPSEFTDALLSDSGIDLYDKKSEAFKEYLKKYNEKPKVHCDVESTKEKINQKKILIEESLEKINTIKDIDLPEHNKKIETGEKYVEELFSKKWSIDEKIVNLDLNQTNYIITDLEGQKTDLNIKLDRKKANLEKLPSEYDKERLDALLLEKDNHREKEFNLKNSINDYDKTISSIKMEISMIESDINGLKRDGKAKKDEIEKLKNSKTCPTCGQDLDEDHIGHINESIEATKKEMLGFADQIKQKEPKVVELNGKISDLEEKKVGIRNDIDTMNDNFQSMLNEIGEIETVKNQVEERKDIQNEIDNIPLQLENLDLKIQKNKDLLTEYESVKSKIEDNEKIDAQIVKAKERLSLLKQEKENLNNSIYELDGVVKDSKRIVDESDELIVKWLKQEEQDEIHKLYKKIIHRNGIPTELLKTYIIPKINTHLNDVMVESDFIVWLDENDLKLKLADNNNLDAVIDAISGSGKERTFASVALKYALNQVNAKSKPSFIMMDEIMGKLVEKSVDEFVSILETIKLKTKKIFIIEHNHNVNPDYVIDVEKDERGCSSLTLN